MHGNLAQSFAFHRLGWLLMLFALVQILRHGAWLGSPGHRPQINIWGRKLDNLLVPLSLLLILNWIIGFFL